jgi:hypothetical protein
VTQNHTSGKNQIPSAKQQIPNNFQVPNPNDPNESPFQFLLLVLVIGSLVFAAYLGLAA